MKFLCAIFFLLLILINNPSLHGQCADIFSQNTSLGSTRTLTTKTQLLVSRQDFDYSIQFHHSSEGFTAVVTTSAIASNLIHPLVKDDMLMFLTSDGQKRPYAFIEEGEKLNLPNGRKAYRNSIQLDPKQIKWLVKSNISQFRLVDMKAEKMYPYSLDGSRKKGLKESLSCFAEELGLHTSEDKDVTTNKGSKNNSTSSITTPSDSTLLKNTTPNNETKGLSQDCQTLFINPSNLKPSHQSSTTLFPLSKSEGFFAQLAFMETDFGLRIKIVCASKGKLEQHHLDKDKKMRFVDTKGNKRQLNFVLDNAADRNKSDYYNTLQLDYETVQWFAKNELQNVQFLYLENKKDILFPLTQEYQLAIKKAATCFLATLNPAKVYSNASEVVQDETHLGESADALTRKSKNQLWVFNDMPLSLAEAEQKYLALLEKKLADISNPTSKDLERNTQLGLAFFEQKKYHKAIPYFEEALNIIQTSKINPKQKPLIEAILATIYINKEQFALAAKHNKEALRLWTNGTTDSLELDFYFKSYLNQAIIFENLEANEQAINLYQGAKNEAKNWLDALKSRRITPIVSPHDSTKTVDFNLALLSLLHAKDLLPQFDKKERINKEIAAQIALGDLYFKADNLETAQNYYDAAFRFIKEHYDAKHPKFIEIQRKLAEIALKKQNYEEALAYANQALGEIIVDQTLLTKKKDLPATFELLHTITTKGIINYEKDHSEEALKKILAEYDVASKMLLELRKTHRNESSNYQLENATDKLSQHAVVVCNQLHTLTQKEDYLEQAFGYAELAKSSVLYEIAQEVKSAAGISEEDIEKENSYRSQLAYLESLIFEELQKGNSKDATRIKNLEHTIAKINKKHQQLLLNFKQKHPQYDDFVRNHKTIKIEDLQKALQANEVFLEYVATDSFVFVLAITPTEIKSQFVHLKERLSRTVKNLQYALRNNKADWYAHTGNELYQATIGELAPFLKNKKLIIAPDAELYYIPFGILPTNHSKIQGTKSRMYQESHYLIQDYPICYNHSAAAFIKSKYQQHRRSNHQIATWAPHFDSMLDIIREKGLGESLLPLPAAEKEAILIAELFENQARIGEEATEAKFKQLANKYSVLHIATHGVLDDVNPLASSLILSNEGMEDGILMAAELYKMQLNANMAVLSACNSGMGKLSKAEGVVGVASGFAYAGVPNIVMSKWPVSDWSTSVLMQSFYEKLKLGMPKDEALQLAKIEYLSANKGKERLLAPFFWGGFVLHGNTEPIDTLSPLLNTYLWLWGGGLLLLFFLFLMLFRKKFKSNHGKENS